MQRVFKNIQLEAFVSGPGFGKKRTKKQIDDFLENSCKALDLLKKRWNENLEPFISLVPSDSEINPFLNGLTGETILLDKNASSSHPFYWSGTRSKTVYEALDSFSSSLTSINQDLFNLKSSVAKITQTRILKYFKDFSDTPSTYFHGQFLKISNPNTKLEPSSTVTGDNTFLGLSNTPNEYTSSRGKLVACVGGNIKFESVEDHKCLKKGDLPGLSPHFFLDNEVSHKIIYVSRNAISSEEIFLPKIADGAEVIIRNYQGSGAGLQTATVTGAAGVAVESGPINLSDSKSFLHLVFRDSESKYYILGYQ